jgi:hypothetical protein
MQMKAPLLFIGALLLLSVAHADVGPPPVHPGMTVTLTQNGNPDLRVSMITFHCMGAETSDNGAVSARIADIPCTTGVCRSDNGAGFYKFNPCNEWPEGYFSYVLNGKTIKTDYFNNTVQHDEYQIAIDSESGKILSTNGSNNPLPSGCLPFFALPCLLVAVAFAGKG